MNTYEPFTAKERQRRWIRRRQEEREIMLAALERIADHAGSLAEAKAVAREALGDPPPDAPRPWGR